MLGSDIMVFDVETTGTDLRRDQIIECCVQIGLEPDARSKTWRIRPSIPITPGAQAVHGISMEDLAECPPFAAYADEIRAAFADARVLVGYNMSFDINMLQAEYERLQQPGLDFGDKQLVDAFRLWQQCEPRSLQHAHQRFVGTSFAEAHSASADVAATGRVLRGMIDAFGLGDLDWNGIAEVCEPERASWAGPSRHLRWTAEGAIAIGFGRHAGTPVLVLAQSQERDYLFWILDKTFPPHVQTVCRRALEMSPEKFREWESRAYARRAQGRAGAFGQARDLAHDGHTDEARNPSRQGAPIEPDENRARHASGRQAEDLAVDGNAEADRVHDPAQKKEARRDKAEQGAAKPAESAQTQLRW